MRHIFLLGLLASMTGCARGPEGAHVRSAGPLAKAEPAGIIATDGPRPSEDGPRTVAGGPWIGASAEGEMLALGTRDTLLGVWVDVPEARPESRPPMDLALVVDTSGSMTGAKIDNARLAASTLVRNMKDGDIVSLDAFSDHARSVVGPTRLDSHSRPMVLGAIQNLGVGGSTNMFDGLTLAESHIAAAPASHPLRRVVMISDGIANVGPSSVESLGALAERGLRFRAQVTSLGVGTDYDERTLDALAIRSSGRLYHLTEPREMPSILKSELALLDATLASESEIEVVAAPGVELLGADGAQATGSRTTLRIPLGALHAGQHREALVRARIVDPSAFETQKRPLASVRLRFRDSQDGDLERIQEVVARAQLTSDPASIASSGNSRAKAIVALMDVAKTQVAVAAQFNDGKFVDADKELAQVQRRLEAQAATVSGVTEKKRLQAAATKLGAARATVQAAPAAPKSVQREQALDMNASGMKDMGY